MDRIEAGLLITGGDEPVRGGVVLVDGDAVSYAGTRRRRARHAGRDRSPRRYGHAWPVGLPWPPSSAAACSTGVTIAMGTDIGLTGLDLPSSWGTNGSELPHLVRLGMTPLQAIAAATVTAPLTLGPQAPKSGRLAAGYDADLITLDADPLADISIIAEPRHVTGVWVHGRQVKGGAAAA